MGKVQKWRAALAEVCRSAGRDGFKRQAQSYKHFSCLKDSKKTKQSNSSASSYLHEGTFKTQKLLDCFHGLSGLLSMLLSSFLIKRWCFLERSFHLGKSILNPISEDVVFRAICVNLKQRRWNFLEKNLASLTNALVSRVVCEFQNTPQLVFGVLQLGWREECFALAGDFMLCNSCSG
ncbi:hypothetical protein NC653_026776 [Populus alba x Populus x berolinensis]|uniref:Uncharacterized protein n=1 Tax=Populus alba x Populus x berolinensis TaxID=444605 RepID=A0AAD6M3W0_9ROSI|nr:hypothetical protein NC653_026776 [Populus alba x Populus x berolinensis]